MLLSYFYNISTRHNKSLKDIRNSNGLIVSSSHQVTHVVPVLNNQWQLPISKRLNLGGYHHNDLLTKSLSLKYPQHKNQMTNEVIQEI